MPRSPIRLVSQQYDLDIFNGSFENDEVDGLSDLQRTLLSNASVTREASKKKEHFTSLLEIIAKAEDTVVTAASKIAYNDDTKIYRVPTEINDVELIGLKTHGLVQGQGRLVKLTESGTNLLRDKWLTSENNIKQKRTKPKFDILKEPKYSYSAANANYVDNSAFKAVASLNDEQKVVLAESILTDIKEGYNDEFINESHAYLRHLIGLEENCPNINIATRTLVANRLASSVQSNRRNG